PTDIWTTKPEVEVYPFGNSSVQPYTLRTVPLGAPEVRDLSKVPPDQLKTYPQQSGGQIHALEQLAGSRLKWHMEIGDDAYFSYVPLGSQKPRACISRMGGRKDRQIQERSRTTFNPIPPFAPATIEVDLRPFAGEEL